ncbi:MAG: hypothetical protein Q3M30_01365 [Candidatus Electrothrix sp. Rat3]|nr:hypothetical protein [Candidatus Electrothrix rattekaaiensis]
MSKEKPLQTVEQTNSKDAMQKLPYEKPSLKAVALFADQVLAGCTKQFPLDPCVKVLGAHDGAS